MFCGNLKNELQLNNLNDSIQPKVAGCHSPICISGNDALRSFISSEGLSGDGSLSNPYIIENYVINASIDNGIEIRHTNAYIIIKNCTIKGIILILKNKVIPKKRYKCDQT